MTPDDVVAYAADPARRVDRYVLVHKLGAGGMGDVWKAWDTSLDRWVALKLVRGADPDLLARFRRESLASAALDHPNVAPVYEAADTHIAMRFVDGDPPRGPLPPHEAARIIRDASRAVAAAHERGIIHRDLKPANILVERPDGHVFVVDFGLARSSRADTMTASGMLVGTPAYLSPEQARGERAGERSDVYALGATLHELLGGRPPFDRPSLVELLVDICESPAPPAAAPPELATIVAKCLEKDPAHRYATAAAVADDLDRFLRHEPVTAKRAPTVRRVAHALSRRRLPLAMAATVAVLGAIALAVLLSRVQRRERDIARQAERRELEDVIARARPLLYVPGGDFARGLADVEKAVARLERVEPKDADAWALLGVGRAFVGDSARAEAALLQAEALAPDDGRVCFTLARLYFERATLERIGDAGERSPHARLAASREWSERAVERMNRGWRSGPADPLERLVVEAYRALGRNDRQAADRLVAESESVPGVAGREELHLVVAILKPTSEGSIAPLTRALEIRPHYAWARFLRAMSLSHVGRHDDAIADCTEAVNVNPRFVQAYVNRGALRLRLGDAAGALDDFGAALRCEPRNVLALTNRAKVRREAGDTVGARADAEAAKHAAPSSPSARMACAMSLKDSGDVDGALRELGEAIRLDPEVASAYVVRGGMLLELDRTDEAASDTDAALRLDPHNARALVNRGGVRHRRGDVPGAIADFTRAAEIEPGNVDAHTNLCGARYVAGDYRGAIAAGTEALRRNPAHIMARLNRAAAHDAAGDPAAALADYHHVLTRQPDHAYALGQRAGLRHRARDLPGAIADYTAALAAGLRTADILANRALARNATGDAAGGLDDASAALALDATCAIAWRARGQARLGTQDYRGAVADYDQALRLEPEIAMAHLNRGVARSRLGDAAGAMADMNDAIRLDPRAFEARINRGAYRYSAGDYDGALADADEAVKLRPDSPDAHYSRAIALHMKRDATAAIAAYEQALALAPAGWRYRSTVEDLLRRLRR